MTTYTVHIFREMRLTYRGIVAGTPEEAAEAARARPSKRADSVADCDGVDLAALVDVVGDDQYRQSRWFNYPVKIIP